MTSIARRRLACCLVPFVLAGCTSGGRLAEAEARIGRLELHVAALESLLDDAGDGTSGDATRLVGRATTRPTG